MRAAPRRARGQQDTAEPGWRGRRPLACGRSRAARPRRARSVPHYSDNVVNVRVQTTGDVTAAEAFKSSLYSLVGVCEHIDEAFAAEVERFKSG